MPLKGFRNIVLCSVSGLSNCTGAFAPLRPQATPATEATFSSGNDGESKLEQRIASSQPGAYQQQAHRAYGWGDQPAAAPGQAHAGAYPPAGQFEQQVTILLCRRLDQRLFMSDDDSLAEALIEVSPQENFASWTSLHGVRSM